MMPDVPMAVIIFDRIRPEERQAAHEIIKANANGWWHHFENTWIAGGKTPGEWRDLLSDVIPTGPSSVIVFALPSTPGWASFSRSGIVDWFHDNL
jgi:hypothetical protein